MQDILYKANADMILYYENGLDAVRKDGVSNLVSGTADANGLYPTQSVFWNFLDATPLARRQAEVLVEYQPVHLASRGGDRGAPRRRCWCCRRRSTAGERE